MGVDPVPGRRICSTGTLKIRIFVSRPGQVRGRLARGARGRGSALRATQFAGVHANPLISLGFLVWLCPERPARPCPIVQPVQRVQPVQHALPRSRPRSPCADASGAGQAGRAGQTLARGAESPRSTPLDSCSQAHFRLSVFQSASGLFRPLVPAKYALP
jgi:hypothetical protein